MALPEVKITGNGIEITEPIAKYINEKLEKYENIFNLATAIDVECTEHVAARGVEQDFIVEISMHLPKVLARVEKRGADVYALVDEVTDVLVRKVKRYKDKLRKWEGETPWKEQISAEMADVKESEVGNEVDVYNYIPKIDKRKTIEDCSPISEEEAIERMEMMGYPSFLFKNLSTGKFSVVYRRREGGYGIVEPCD